MRCSQMKLFPFVRVCDSALTTVFMLRLRTFRRVHCALEDSRKHFLFPSLGLLEIQSHFLLPSTKQFRLRAEKVSVSLEYKVLS